MQMARALGLVAVAAACSAQRPSAMPSNMTASRTTTASSAAQSDATAEAGALRVAITLDDLGATPESAAPQLSERILAALQASRAPVAVFVNCQNLRSEALGPWQRAGATFGNHTASHLSLDAAGPDETWWSDVKSCDEQLRRSLGEPVGFFRFPFLRYGKTAESHAAAARKLAALGYRIAHVTAATSEWLIAGYYDQALKSGDAALLKELSEAYVEHMVESLRAARDPGKLKVHRDVSQITLAHVNRLAADHLRDVLQALSADGWQFVTLEEALRDPVYALPDRYLGGCGCSWLARIDPPLTRDDTYAFGDDEDRLRERFEARVKALGVR